MHLTSLSLHNFKRFEEPTVIPLAPRLTVLVGQNRTGKTSVLQAFALLGFISNTERDGKGNFIGGPSSQIVTAGTRIAGNYRQLYSAGKSELILGLNFSDGTSISTKLRDDDPPVVTSDCQRDSHGLWVTYVPHDLSFPTTTDEKKVKDSKLNEMLVTANGELTANYVAALKSANQLTVLTEIMQKVFPGLGAIEVVSTKEAHRLRFSNGKHCSPWYNEGRGVCFALTILAAVLYGKFQKSADHRPYDCHQLLVLDEPTSLHPQAFSVFMDTLFGLNVQIVIATHSVDFLLAHTNQSQSKVRFVSLEDEIPVLITELEHL